MTGFNIESAEDQGYFVAETQTKSRHENSFIKCAGTLEECLSYIRGQFEEYKEIQRKIAAANEEA